MAVRSFAFTWWFCAAKRYNFFIFAATISESALALLEKITGC
jgi:hypothetical protein